jgi:hypothetical protein
MRVLPCNECLVGCFEIQVVHLAIPGFEVRGFDRGCSGACEGRREYNHQHERWKKKSAF